MLVDTHCHLNFNAFDPDRGEVLARAGQARVKLILNPSIDLASCQEAVKLADMYSEVYAAVGVHPNDCQDWGDSLLDELRNLTSHAKVIAIGEIGLDYYWNKTSPSLQKQVLIQQLNLAAELELPVIIHIRDRNVGDSLAMNDILDILDEWTKHLVVSGSPLFDHPGVLHSFSGNLSAAQRAVSMHFFIGIAGPVTFKKSTDLQSLVVGLPLEHILLETDAPFLTPEPFRGRRNEPSNVRFIAEKIAKIHNLPLDMIADVTGANAGRLFKWQVIN